MKVACVVQARMTSTRLPGKVLKEVEGKPLLEYQLERLRQVPKIDDIIIATTLRPTDDPIVTLCEKLSFPFFRGSEEDVLGRYYGAVSETEADVVIRSTSDCPLIDPQVVSQVLSLFEKGSYDYVSNTLQRSYPRGLDVEVFSRRALEIAHSEASAAYEREHVTPYFYLHPEKFHLAQVKGAQDHSHHRWTVDTSEDFELVSRILKTLYPKNPYFQHQDVLELLEKHPEWCRLNEQVKQKEH